MLQRYPMPTRPLPAVLAMTTLQLTNVSTAAAAARRPPSTAPTESKTVGNAHTAVGRVASALAHTRATPNNDSCRHPGPLTRAVSLARAARTAPAWRPQPKDGRASSGFTSGPACGGTQHLRAIAATSGGAVLRASCRRRILCCSPACSVAPAPCGAALPAVPSHRYRL